MPIIGYFLASLFSQEIINIDHRIAFILLSFIGGKMIRESYSLKKTECPEEEAPLDFKKMFPLAIATSIDALAAGVSFAFLDTSILPATLVIGICTLLLSMLGIKISKFLGTKFEKKAELIGGTILILMGIKILLEHLGIFSF
jgi:putative Mn2+ efflux pump MntP